MFSIILYDLLTPNNRYCEPNRMYQAITLGVPVIVGCNEPMAELVSKYKFGMVLSDAGRDLGKIKSSIHLLLNNIDEFKANIAREKHRLNWREQEMEILKIISK